MIKDEAYYAAVAEGYDLGRTKGIDAALKQYKIEALVLPTDGIALCDSMEVLLSG